MSTHHGSTTGDPAGGQQTSGHPAHPRPGARSARSARVARGGRSHWKLATGLYLLAAIPLAAGTLRLVQLSGGPDLIPADPRFDAAPAAVVLHIVASAVFALLGVLQLLPKFRRTHRTWHRRAGRVLVAAGLLVTSSALWLTLFYDPQPGTGRLLFAFRLVVVTAMTVSIERGFTAIRRRDITLHRAWMIRAYALGLGAGTQALTEGFAEALLGHSVLIGDLAKGAGWAINLLIAEWVIRRPATTRRKS